MCISKIIPLLYFKTDLVLNENDTGLRKYKIKKFEN